MDTPMQFVGGSRVGSLPTCDRVPVLTSTGLNETAPRTVLESVVVRTAALGSDLLRIEERLRNLQRRAYGHEEGMAEGKALPAPDGFASVLGQHLEVNEATVGRIVLLLESLESFG